MCDVSRRFSVHAFTHYRKRDTVINQCKGRKGVHAFTCLHDICGDYDFSFLSNHGFFKRMNGTSELRNLLCIPPYTVCKYMIRDKG